MSEREECEGEIDITKKNEELTFEKLKMMKMEEIEKIQDEDVKMMVANLSEQEKEEYELFQMKLENRMLAAAGLEPNIREDRIELFRGELTMEKLKMMNSVEMEHIREGAVDKMLENMSKEEQEEFTKFQFQLEAEKLKDDYGPFTIENAFLWINKLLGKIEKLSRVERRIISGTIDSEGKIIASCPKKKRNFAKFAERKGRKINRNHVTEVEVLDPFRVQKVRGGEFIIHFREPFESRPTVVTCQRYNKRSGDTFGTGNSGKTLDNNVIVAVDREKFQFVCGNSHGNVCGSKSRCSEFIVTGV